MVPCSQKVMVSLARVNKFTSAKKNINKRGPRILEANARLLIYAARNLLFLAVERKMEQRQHLHIFIAKRVLNALTLAKQSGTSSRS